MPTEEELISALQEFDDSVTYTQFDAEGRFSTTAVKNCFGSWNEAKRAAGMEVTPAAKKGSPPDTISLSQERWEEISSEMRAIYRRRDKSAKLQLEEGCEYCGYADHPAALQWHHINPENKEAAVSTLIQRAGWDTVKAEIDKCIVLCANCHRVEEDSTQEYPECES